MLRSLESCSLSKLMAISSFAAEAISLLASPWLEGTANIWYSTTTTSCCRWSSVAAGVAVAREYNAAGCWRGGHSCVCPAFFEPDQSFGWSGTFLSLVGASTWPDCWHCVCVLFAAPSSLFSVLSQTQVYFFLSRKENPKHYTKTTLANVDFHKSTSLTTTTKHEKSSAKDWCEETGKSPNNSCFDRLSCLILSPS